MARLGLDLVALGRRAVEQSRRVDELVADPVALDAMVEAIGYEPTLPFEET